MTIGADDPARGSGDLDQIEHEPALYAIPDYPLHALPVAARQLVEYGLEVGLPPALVAGASIGALAAAIGPAAEIEVIPTWQERAILWIPLVAPRGAGKSPAQDLAFRPLRENEVEANGESPDDGRKITRILSGDVTLESLARSLAETEGAGVLDLDELAVLLRGLGEYKRGGGDRGRLLRLWSGAPVRYTRVGAPGRGTNGVDLYIPRPTVVICGGLQPGLHDLMGGEEDGLRPRWVPHLAAMPTMPVGLAHARLPQAWQRLLAGELLPYRTYARSWKLDGETREAFEDYRIKWKRQARELETASTSAALVKADVHLLRFALALAEGDEPRRGGPVEPQVIERAASIVEYGLNCWRALPEQGALGLSRRDEALDRGITRLIGWLEEHGGVTDRRALQRAHVAGARTAQDLGALLKRYEDVYPGTVTTATRQRGGRPTTIVRAPARRPVSTLLPRGDTGKRDGAPVNDSGGFWMAACGDTGLGDTGLGDTERGDGGTEWRAEQNVDCVAPDRHAKHHIPHHVTGRRVCQLCHPLPLVTSERPAAR